MQHVENELLKHNFVAIGEIGIDLYWDKTTLENQKKAFGHQIQLAKKYKLPTANYWRIQVPERKLPQDADNTIYRPIIKMPAIDTRKSKF